MKYLVVIEESETGFGAYVPDLPGCIAAARTGPSLSQPADQRLERLERDDAVPDWNLLARDRIDQLHAQERAARQVEREAGR